MDDHTQQLFIHIVRVGSEGIRWFRSAEQYSVGLVPHQRQLRCGHSHHRQNSTSASLLLLPADWRLPHYNRSCLVTGLRRVDRHHRGAHRCDSGRSCYCLCAVQVGINMVTYSQPIISQSGKFLGVATIDVTVDALCYGAQCVSLTQSVSSAARWVGHSMAFVMMSAIALFLGE